MRYIRKVAKKLFLLLAIALTVSFSSEVFAAEIQESDTYVLDRDANGGYLYLYQSPCMLGYDINNQYGGNGVQTQIFVFSMYNTQDHTFIPAYCIDMGITAVQGADYRRLNLEDSTYAGNVAGKLRAILKNGFYFTPEEMATEEIHLANINQRLAELEQASGAVNLTVGEAISATQTALWQTAHGPIISYPNFCRYVFNVTETKYASLCNDPALKAKGVEANKETIKKVYDYLLTLDPISADQKTVSPSSFVELSEPVLNKNDDGTYDVSVSTTVDVDMTAQDTLTLTVKLGETYTESCAIYNGTQAVTLTLENVPADLATQDVTLSLSGYQTVEGYFLFDSRDGRETSQTMAGYNNSQLPVYAEVKASENRIVKFEKTTSTFKPISDIVFDIYYVGSLKDLSSLPDAKQHPYANAEKEQWPDYSVITDDNGFASLNFTQQGLDDGVYLIIERENPKVVKPLEPFYIYVPYTDENGTHYQITLYPKNELVEESKFGGIRLTKVDAFDSDVTLSGAKFQVYRIATQSEVAAGMGEVIPGILGKAIPVTFYDNAEMTGDPLTSVTSDKDGSVCIYGLEYGTYYLVETSAPDGYTLLEDPIEITIDDASYTNASIVIENTQALILPETGGTGTTFYTLTGTILVCMACLLLYFNKCHSQKNKH